MVRLKKDERRRQIIETAARVFAERGLAGTRTREIAQACGVNEALLYKHFRSKEEVFIEVMRHIHENFVESWRVEVNAAPDGRTALQNLIKFQTEEIFAKPAMAANLLHGVAAATDADRVHDIFAEWFEEHHKFLENVIKCGIEDGSLRSDIDPFRAAWWFRGLAVSGLMISATGIESKLNAQTSIETYNDLVELISA